MVLASQVKRLHIIYALNRIIAHASLSESFMDCNICIQLASDPVVTTCGHLFCWPCLYTWLNSNLQPHSCPVCRAYVTRDVNIIPVYKSGENTFSHANNTNNDGATISSRPSPPRFLHQNPRRILHSSNLQGSNPMHIERWEARCIEIWEELERTRSYTMHYLHTINTLRVEQDGLRSEIDHLRRVIDHMWRYEFQITDELDDLAKTIHELQRAILTKNQAYENLLNENKKLRKALFIGNPNVGRYNIE